MKVITAALVCLLLARAWLQDVDAKSMHVSSSNCCFTLVERKMSLQRIQCYKNTSSTCSYKNHLIGRPGIRIADARWRCSTGLRFFNQTSEEAKTWAQS
uniref:C-C motif chemokine 1-like n=1 Tax=Phocoena sinus TaxID=42100 RepID=A0A8C9CQJ6_PHOSS